MTKELKLEDFIYNFNMLKEMGLSDDEAASSTFSLANHENFKFYIIDIRERMPKCMALSIIDLQIEVLNAFADTDRKNKLKRSILLQELINTKLFVLGKKDESEPSPSPKLKEYNFSHLMNFIDYMKNMGISDKASSMNMYFRAKDIKYSFSKGDLINELPYNMAVGLLTVHKASLMVEPVSEFRPLGNVITNLPTCEFNIYFLISNEFVKQNYRREKSMNAAQQFLHRTHFFRNSNFINNAITESEFRTKELSRIEADLEYAVNYFKQVNKPNDDKVQAGRARFVDTMRALLFKAILNDDRSRVKHAMRKYDLKVRNFLFVPELHCDSHDDLLKMARESEAHSMQHRLYKEPAVSPSENIALCQAMYILLKEKQKPSTFVFKYSSDDTCAQKCKCCACKDEKKEAPDAQQNEQTDTTKQTDAQETKQPATDKQPEAESGLGKMVYTGPTSPVMKGKIDQSIIKEAMRILSGERQADYGDPVRNFVNIARIVSGRSEHDVSPVDCVNVLLAVKECREEFNHKRDNVVDYVAYQEIKRRIIEWCKTHDWNKD